MNQERSLTEENAKLREQVQYCAYIYTPVFCIIYNSADFIRPYLEVESHSLSCEINFFENKNEMDT